MKITHIKPITHAYYSTKITRFKDFLYNFIGVSLPLFGIVFPFAYIITRNDVLTWRVFVSSFVKGLLWGIPFLLNANFDPDVISDEQGLHLTFFWQQIDISWKDVIAIKPIFLIFGSIKKHAIVRTRSLTLFHRIIGLMYSFSILPSFHISAGLSDYDVLVGRINCKIRENQNKTN